MDQRNETFVPHVLAIVAGTTVDFPNNDRTYHNVFSLGDLTRRIHLPSGTRWEDEDARLLASSFNSMTNSIARFQRDAAQRERFSSLGRLSTVVAHEIRNPLMIIKMALRGLRQGTVAPAQLQAAVSDIDEEVARLKSSRTFLTSRGRSDSKSERWTSTLCVRTPCALPPPMAVATSSGSISRPAFPSWSRMPSGCGSPW